MAVSESRYAATWWIRLDDGRIRRDVCPRACALHEGQTGLCFVRMGAGNQIVLTTSSSGFCVDPIEKKPVDHFLPGTSVLSFGTAGCNLACRFCQNRDMSKSREMDTLADAASPGQIAEAASRLRAETVGRRDVALHADDGVQLEQRHRRRGILEIHLALLTVICSTSRRKGTGVDLQPDRKRGLGADTGAEATELGARDRSVQLEGAPEGLATEGVEATVIPPRPAPMILFVPGVWTFLHTLFVQAANVSFENVGLRHQLAVSQRSVFRPKLSSWSRP